MPEVVNSREGDDNAMTTNQLSLARARASIGIVPLIVAAVQAILLYVTTSSTSILNTV